MIIRDKYFMNFSEHRPKVYFKTFGCRTNIFDTQVMISNLKDFDVTNNEKRSKCCNNKLLYSYK